MCVILLSQQYKPSKLLTFWKNGGMENERDESEILSMLWYADGK